MCKRMKKQGRVPRVLVTDMLRSDATANRVREKVMRQFKSAQHRQRFASTHDQVANLFMHSRYNRDAAAKRAARSQTFAAWGQVSGARMFGVTAM
jgi:putative transposase